MKISWGMLAANRTARASGTHALSTTLRATQKMLGEYLKQILKLEKALAEDTAGKEDDVQVVHHERTSIVHKRALSSPLEPLSFKRTRNFPNKQQYQQSWLSKNFSPFEGTGIMQHP